MMQIADDSGKSPSSGRRRWLVGGMASGVAVLAGASLSWWHRAAGRVADPVPGFWAQQWQSPHDAPMAMRAFQGRPVLINFWATWCPPCVDELPMLDRFYAEQGQSGVQVLGLAIDRKEAVLPFLRRMPLRFPVAMAGLSGADLGRALGNMAGGLPFSVLIASDGVVAHRKMGRVTEEDLRAWAAVK